MEFGIVKLPSLPINEIVKLYQKAEDAGITYGWTCDEVPSSPFRDPYAVLAALGYNTHTMKLGTAIHVPYTRHPAQLAYGAKSYEELFPGRIILGIGPGGVLSLKPLGIKMWDRPLTALRETIHICRELFAGHTVTFEGELFKLYDAKLYEQPKTPIPIYLAARGPKILQIVGEIADGSICTFAPGTVPWGIKHIETGAKKANRSLKDITVFSGVALSVSKNRDKAREIMKENLGPSIVYASPKTHELTGVNPKDLEKVQQEVAGGWGSAGKYITDEMIDLYSFSGTQMKSSKNFEHTINKVLM